MTHLLLAPVAGLAAVTPFGVWTWLLCYATDKADGRR